MRLFQQTLSNFPRYEHHHDQIQNGDIIAFSGNDVFSCLIKQKTNSNYSHVGIVLDVDMNGGFGKSILIIESSTEIKHRDTDDKEVIKGVQMHWLSTRLEMYEGEVWWIPLREKIPQEGLLKMQAWLRDTHNQKVPYDFVQVFGAGIDLFDSLGFENKRDFSRLFCSELVAKALQEAGVISSDVNPSEQTPEDIVTLPCFKEPVSLKNLSQTELG